ncbi:RNA recognition motif domain-containing protein [Vibrio panuliri]|uniref:RNA-binding protein n=1 Tax=Vibrio panuliri TaxID=1381081 RepID=A0A1Q9HHA6_9VIBR|nr:RNA-binding protein [Vibrio panuliri]KAB1460956.1 RNA-binding protein [Vibrio panuliri]OLQ89396.1 RNA-binding protein [Vibrio panuliri]OLQ96247.1 RNA-binding protein [Vibrio panuliri]
MSSNKSTILLIAIAVLGALIFFKLDISPAISFVIGVVASAFVLKLSNATTNELDTPLNDPATKTLYVGNLPYKANESHVKDLFAEHGEVFAVRLMKDKRTGKRRGFGFVVMAASDAETAIAGLNEKDYMQRTLKVRIANEPKSQEERDELD